MLSSRYQEINTLLDELLQMPREQRVDFLERTCGSDQELRKTLEGLLVAYESEDGFLDTPALVQLEKDRSARPQWSDLRGHIVGGYEIVQPLGAGALAEVWLAKDRRLQRLLALKLLRNKFVRDSNQVLRFEQEARAASKLSHPNIVTIHEIGESNGFHFIAQEFVNGVTLRKRLSEGLLPLDATIEIALQVAGALAAAHKSGVIHRDIKPENLMIRTDGLVKVLDFGIARVVEEAPQREAEPQENLTTPGLILGTVKYMSPEQARGVALDGRSDLFSFGVVLYEMVAGVAPFSGPTVADTLAAVLAREPVPVAAHRPEVPAHLEQLILRCLKKEREERIPSADELCNELKAVASEMAQTQSTPLSKRKSAAASLHFRLLSRRGLLSALSIIVAIGVVLTLVSRLAQRHATTLPFDSPEMTRLTLPGEVTDAAIAPDGKAVVYLLQGTRGPSLWIRQLGLTQDAPVVTLPPGVYQNLIYSPDGAYIYYIQIRNLTGTLYRVRAAGSQPQKVLDDVTGRVSFSPGGKQLAFVRVDQERWEESLIVANADGTGERRVATRGRPYYYSQLGVGWSRDGNSIFCLAGKESFYKPNAYRVVRIDVGNGRETPVSTQTWARVGSLIASFNEPMLIVSGNEHSGRELQLWRVSYADGRVTRITRDLSNYTKLSLSANSQTLLAVRRARTADLWTMPVNNSNAATDISSGEIPELTSGTWLGDGEIVYSALAGDFVNIWKMNASGQNATQLTRVAVEQGELAATRDGRYILYQSGGKIWRMNAGGSEARQLTRGNLDVHPAASPDGRWVVYASFQNWSPDVGGKPSIWKVPIDGGTPVRVSTDYTSIPVVSPDGKRIACALFHDNKLQSPPAIAIYPFAGGPAIQVFERPDGSDDKVYWSRDGKSIDYIVTRGDISNIWRQPLDGRAPAPITQFRTDSLFFLSPSDDGTRMLLGRGKEVNELVLITQANRQ